MCSVCRSLALLLSLVLAGGAAARELRVCADPNNLPFSDRRGDGFENRIAVLLAAELGADLEYVWWAQRRGFLRNTLNAGRCDLLVGVPSGLEAVRTTLPYYRTSYVFVQRREAPAIGSLDDPALRRLRIGVPLVGDDGANPPPVHALAARGLVANVRGYPVYGDYRRPEPAAALLEALAKGDIDIAVAWGPFAGYFAARRGLSWRLAPVAPAVDGGLPMQFDIAMGVRRGDDALLAEVEAALDRRRADIAAILDSYGVPRLPPQAGASERGR